MKKMRQTDPAKMLKEVFRVLKLVFNDGKYMDKAIETVMRENKTWGVKDRAFVSESVHEIIRNWRLLTTLAEVDAKIINDEHLWTIYGVWLITKGSEPDTSTKFKSVKPEKVKAKLAKYKGIRKLAESYPDWLDEVCEKELGGKWNAVSKALNKPAKMVLRANSLKSNVKELQTLLQEQNMETRTLSWAPEALELVYSRNVFRTEQFKEGWFEVQDAASQMVSDFLDVKPGMRVVDACAGAGGKTLHLAALMKNKGRILALDTKAYKLEELKKRSKRAGVSIVESKIIDTTKVVKRLHESADRVLLDVPCSGLGVLRRNPDAKWKMQPEELERVRIQQQELLERFAPVTKKGGKMIYATCSILPSEGEKQVQQFLKAHPDWTLEGEKRYSPDVDQCDGFYMALMKRK